MKITDNVSADENGNYVAFTNKTNFEGNDLNIQDYGLTANDLRAIANDMDKKMVEMSAEKANKLIRDAANKYAGVIEQENGDNHVLALNIYRALDRVESKHKMKV